MNILLASRSPRRRQLLSQLGFPLSFVDINVDEAVPAATPVELISSHLARRKSRAYDRPLCDGDVLVTADTVVVHRGRVLGKPHDSADAVRMLHELSADVNTVFTGVCLRTARREVLFSERTDVYFKELSDEVINTYVDMGTCLDKAGAYGIQEWIGMVGVERIEGDYYNVVGLPLARLYQELTGL